MDVLYILIPLSLGMAICGLLACIWAIRSGQFRDTRGPAEILVFEEPSVPEADGSNSDSKR